MPPSSMLITGTRYSFDFLESISLFAEKYSITRAVLSNAPPKIQDSRYDHNYNTLWGRLKRAAKILFGKPIYYNDVFLNGEDTFKKLVEDMDNLARSNLSGEGGQ